MAISGKRQSDLRPVRPWKQISLAVILSLVLAPRAEYKAQQLTRKVYRIGFLKLFDPTSGPVQREVEVAKRPESLATTAKSCWCRSRAPRVPLIV